MTNNIRTSYRVSVSTCIRKQIGRLTLPIIVLGLAQCFVGCRSASEKKGAETAKSGETIFDRTEIRHARGFSITYHDDYKIVNIFNPFEKTSDTTRYLLLRRGAVKPAGFDRSILIEIPLRSIVAMSSTHIGLLEFLEADSILTGLGNLQYVYSPEVIRRIETGKISEVGKDQGLNEEKLITMHPDLVMTTGSPGAKMDHYKLLEQAGIPVIVNSEWVETTPLGRAEWVKLLAALLNKEKLVNEKFREIENEYHKLVSIANNAKRKPMILSGLNTKDVWFLPNGNSYMAAFFTDAGGNYPWAADKRTGSLPLSFEAVSPIALKADVWMNVGFDSGDTKASILMQDSRYGDFQAFKTGRMYSYNNRINTRGSNDFFESGNVQPHVILADLIKILHPELLPDHRLVYYKQLK